MRALVLAMARLACAAAWLACAAAPLRAADSVQVGTTLSITDLPFFIAESRGYFTDGSPPPPSSNASNAQSGYRTDLNCTWAINPLQSSGEFSFPVAIVVECVLSAFAVIPFFDCLTGTWTSS